MLKRLLALSGAFICLTPPVSPQADYSGISAPDVIIARQASLDMSSIAFHSMGDAMKAGREAKSQSYPAAALAKWARTLPRMFPSGTGKGETSASSQALPEIWRDRKGFDRAAANYANATSRLSALAAANDTAEFTKQLDVVNQACSFCHASYKAGDQGPPKK